MTHDLRPSAWLAVGSRHYCSVHLDRTRAVECAAQHHGHVIDLVRIDRVSEALRAAWRDGYELGLEDGRNRPNARHG
ncbi:hypothetical protein MOJ79_06430 [Calidifontimicrobium sp. SYSU G02091]|jgi:hypothetical protein|uniref:hypothetical protein n=1 Tax=Calidifontimicrobium sp. SYSU G02091 TaxID=2926421 RepID=UPI001F534325|nr:hypothetical protein [Calidifontimicrobium sp. SYSU G02091]MCI1191475.1 hypothetical protein [Calidifontimicrobium sp. SYSU G02091]